MDELYADLKGKRLEAGLSQAELAQRAQVSLATVQNIEAGRANPALKTIQNICAVLGLTLSTIPSSLHGYIMQLTQIGVPLMDGNQGAKSLRCDPEKILRVLNESTPVLKRFRPETRERRALTAYLWAIKDHYPSLWARLDKPLRVWLDHTSREGLSIKLRRIALANLSQSL